MLTLKLEFHGTRHRHGLPQLDCQLWQAERTTRRHSRDDPREDVGVGVGVRIRVGVGPVEFQLKPSFFDLLTSGSMLGLCLY